MSPASFLKYPANSYALDELIVADAASPEIMELVSGATEATFLLDECTQPLQVLTALLASETIETLHIVAHGVGGTWWLGGQVVTTRTLQANAHLLSQWNVERIALWVCQAGANTLMVNTLARLTGAQVLASPGKLGVEPATGLRHWELRPIDEPGLGCLHGCSVFGADTVNAWPHQLAKAERPD